MDGKSFITTMSQFFSVGDIQMDPKKAGSTIYQYLKSVPVPIILLIFARLIFLMVSSIQEVYGFGDVLHFFNMAQFHGLPFINYWDEHPPFHAFLSKMLFYIVSGRENAYVNLLYLVFMLVDAGSLALFIRLTRRLTSQPVGEALTWFFMVVLIVSPYYWWYFDGFGAFWLLLSLVSLIEGRDRLCGVALALSTLTKLFPILFLAAIWRALPWRRALVISLITLGLTFSVYGGLFALSPSFTSASVASQVNKGSWETVWALVDGNYQTGNFLVEEDHFYPERAYQLKRNPAVISPWITLVIFAGLGLWTLFKAKIKTETQLVSCLGFSLVLLFLWSPGWSPQYILFLIPLILLSLPVEDSRLITGILVLINLLEWPVLLSRGLNWTLLFTAPIRTLILVLIAGLWYQQVVNPEKHPGNVKPEVISEVGGQVPG
jgi:Glycosyltransferase family 87